MLNLGFPAGRVVFRAPERGVAGSGLSPFLAFWRSENTQSVAINSKISHVRSQPLRQDRARPGRGR